jgi:hypothetical protein
VIDELYDEIEDLEDEVEFSDGNQGMMLDEPGIEVQSMADLMRAEDSRPNQ